MDPTGSPKIVWLSGPSSSGKTHSTKSLEEKGWIRLEADVERTHVEVALLKTVLLDKLTYLESHFTNPAPETTIGAICGGTKPVKMPEDPGEYERVRLELLRYINDKNQDVSQAVLIHMLDKAIALSALGKSIILDHVPFVNDPGFSSHKVTRDLISSNLWCYRGVKIEQQLKYVPVEVLMRNVIRRNHNPDDHRPMTMVLEQYAERFRTSTNPKEEKLGILFVRSLKEWVQRAVKIDFFDINPNHGFKFDATRDGSIDQAIEDRLVQFNKEIDDPENAIDPADKKVDAENVERLKERKTEYPRLQEKIDEMTSKIMQLMEIPVDATDETVVNLTYKSTSGIEPTIIKDIP